MPACSGDDASERVSFACGSVSRYEPKPGIAGRRLSNVIRDADHRRARDRNRSLLVVGGIGLFAPRRRRLRPRRAAPAPAPAPAPSTKARRTASSTCPMKLRRQRSSSSTPATAQSRRADSGRRAAARHPAVAGRAPCCLSRCRDRRCAGPGVDQSELPPADRARRRHRGVVDLAARKLVRNLDERPGSGGVRHLARRQDALQLSNEDAAEMSVHRLSAADGFARASRSAKSPKASPSRPDGRGCLRRRARRPTKSSPSIRRRSRWSDEIKTAARPRVDRVHRQTARRPSLPTRPAATVERDRRREARTVLGTTIMIPQGQAPRRRGRWAQCSRLTDRRSTSRSVARRRLPSSMSRRGARTRTNRGRRRSVHGGSRQRRRTESLHRERSVRRCVVRGRHLRHRRAAQSPTGGQPWASQRSSRKRVRPRRDGAVYMPPSTRDRLARSRSSDSGPSHVWRRPTDVLRLSDAAERRDAAHVPASSAILELRPFDFDCAGGDAVHPDPVLAEFRQPRPS